MFLLAVALLQPLDTIAPRASGVALAEVVDVSEYDARPMDGNKGIEFKLRRVRGSGYFNDTIDVVTEPGGLRPPGSDPKPSAPMKVKADSLKKGERYWFAFASLCEYEKYNQGVIGFWPEKDKVAETLEAAVKGDVYRWQPQYDPRTRLSYGHLVGRESWRVRVERAGKVLWEKEIPGTMTGGFITFRLTGAHGYPDLFPAKMPPCGQILCAVTTTALAEGNEYGLPAGTYKVEYGFDPETGKRHATWVDKENPPGVALIHREYDPDLDKPTREDRFDFQKTGGKKVGAKTEEWYRKTSRTFDPATGKVTKEDVYRYDPDAGPDERWVKVDR